jgi:hypothetical protein
VAELLLVLVPVELVPCQYQVTPPGGVPRVSLVLPQLFCTEGVEGVEGAALMLTDTERLLLQQPEELFLALR